MAVAQALKKYASLKISPNHRAYDFSEGELEKVAYDLLNTQKFGEALRVFRLNIEFYPSSTNAKAGLANALLLQGKSHAADQEYLKVRRADPSNYYLNLFSHHEDNLIPFILLGFEEAKEVTLFLRNTTSGALVSQALKTNEKGKWNTNVKVPPGQYTYSFRVDDSFIVDPRNRMTKYAGRYLNSYLISR